MKYKLIVADFDDTIMNEELQISDTLSDTIKRYEKAGGHFHIATGRMTSSILRYAKQLGLTGEVLSFQGSVATDIESGDTIKTFSIDATTATNICRYLEEKGLYFHTYEGDNLVTKEQNLYSKIYQRFCACGSIELGYPVSEYLEKLGLAPVKIVVMDVPENVPGHIADLTARYGDKLLINTSKEWLVEIISKEVSKGRAVNWLSDRLGITRDETITIGDSLNDATMLEWAGLSFAVANGSDAAKSIAKAVCPSCDNKGVEWVIRKYGLGEEV